jgi:AraC-like DNA-binding protein
LDIAEARTELTKTRVIPVATNLAYIGHGTRMYGLRPVLGRARGFWELQWVLRGEARPDNIDAREAKAPGPRLYVSHPDSPHGWTDDGGRSSEIFVLHFRDVPEELAATVNPAKTLIVGLDESEARQHRGRLDEIRRVHDESDPRLALKLGQILIEVSLLMLGRAAPDVASSRDLGRVERALHWFEENIGEHPSAEDVARAVGVSSAHLRRLFTAAGKDAPKAEFTRLRIAVAGRCLREGWKLDRIAGYLGYSEASAFSRAFSASCGASPREWLKRECGAREPARRRAP